MQNCLAHAWTILIAFILQSWFYFSFWTLFSTLVAVFWGIATIRVYFQSPILHALRPAMAEWRSKLEGNRKNFPMSLSCPVLPYPILPCWSDPTLPYSTLPYPTQSYCTKPYPTLPYSTLTYSTLSYPTLHYATLLYPTLFYLPNSTLLYPWSNRKQEVIWDTGRGLSIYETSKLTHSNTLSPTRPRLLQ